MLCLGMHSNVMLRFIVQVFRYVAAPSYREEASYNFILMKKLGAWQFRQLVSERERRSFPI